MRRAAGLRLLAVAGLFAMAGCDPDVTSPQDASQRVRGSYAWMADAELCPADVMGASMRMNGLSKVTCAGAELPTCFRRCRKGDVDSCYWLANTLQEVDSTDGAAQALYQRACALGEPSGCTNRAAEMYMTKRRDAGVMQCAARTFDRTCQLHDAWGCAMYGLALHEGSGVPPDDAHALEVLAGACRNHDDTNPACRAAQGLTDMILPMGAAAPGADRVP